MTTTTKTDESTRTFQTDCCIYYSSGVRSDSKAVTTSTREGPTKQRSSSSTVRRNFSSIYAQESRWRHFTRSGGRRELLAPKIRTKNCVKKKSPSGSMPVRLLLVGEASKPIPCASYAKRGPSQGLSLTSTSLRSFLGNRTVSNWSSVDHITQPLNSENYLYTYNSQN